MEDFHSRILRSKGVAYGIRCDKCGTSATFKKGVPCPTHTRRICDRSPGDTDSGGLPDELAIETFADSGSGVSSKLSIPEATIFGPFVGLATKLHGEADGFRKWLLDTNLKASLESLRSQSDEACNWMKHVRTANSSKEENLVAYHSNGDVFFLSTAVIKAGDELRVRNVVSQPTSRGTQQSGDVEPRRSARQKRAQLLELRDEDGQSSSAGGGQKHRKVAVTEQNGGSLGGASSSDDPSQASASEDTTERKTKRSKVLREKTVTSRSIARSFRGVKRQNHMQHIEDKLQMIVDINPYQFTEWQTSYSLWKTAFERLLEERLVEDESEGPHRLKSLVNRQVASYKTRLERTNHHEAECAFPQTRKDYLLQKILQLITGKEVWEAKCPDCLVEFPTEDLLLLHQVKHSNGQHPIASFVCPSVCPVCGVGKDSAGALADHVDVHGRQGSQRVEVMLSGDFPCPKCKQRFGKEKYLTRHLGRMHPEGAEKFDCPECPRHFESLATMRKHNTRCHGTKRVVECPACSEKLPDVAALQAHTEGHRNEDGQYPCPHCPGKAYKDFKLFRKHIRTNHGTATFACPVCQKVFKRLTALQVHEVVHSADFNFECRICGRKFKRKEKLQEHTKRLHNPQREYKYKERSESIARAFAGAVVCVYCTKQYANAGRLEQHQRLKHPGEVVGGTDEEEEEEEEEGVEGKGVSPDQMDGNSGDEEGQPAAGGEGEENGEDEEEEEEEEEVEQVEEGDQTDVEEEAGEEDGPTVAVVAAP